MSNVKRMFNPLRLVTSRREGPRQSTQQTLKMSGAPMPSSFDDNSEFYEENRWQKFSRRLKEEPLIPLGCALTCYALLGATRSIRAGDHARTNRMFRARIYAQGFTLAALVAGSMYYQTDRDKRKQFDKVVTEKKAQEKNQAWIRELEARDEEEKLARGRREAAREAAASVSRANCMVEKSERRGEGVLRAVRELWRR